MDWLKRVNDFDVERWLRRRFGFSLERESDTEWDLVVLGVTVPVVVLWFLVGFSSNQSSLSLAAGLFIFYLLFVFSWNTLHRLFDRVAPGWKNRPTFYSLAVVGVVAISTWYTVSAMFLNPAGFDSWSVMQLQSVGTAMRSCVGAGKFPGVSVSCYDDVLGRSLNSSFVCSSVLSNLTGNNLSQSQLSSRWFK